MGQKNDFNNQENVQSYFKNNKNVYEWWNPTTDHMANIYNYGLIKSVEYLENLLEKSNILDAACGKGRITKYLSAKFHVEACDINPYMVEHVKN